MKRRAFLEISGSSILGAMISPSFSDLLSSDGKLREIGLQLYTVRDGMGKNPVATIKKIADLGYKHVECAGYKNGKFYGLDKKDFKALLDDNGLKMWSGHTNTGFGKKDITHSMINNWEAVCQDAAFIGQKYIGCGYFEVGERKTIDDYKKHAALFNKCAETAKKYSLTFFHHNHDFEFIPINGIIPYDVLLKETDTKLVKFELDHYWTKKANVDSLKLMAENKGRFPLWHIKDMDNSSEKLFAEVGTGIIDYKAIFSSKAKSSMDLFFVEQDSNHKVSPLNSIEISIRNLKEILA